MTTKTHCDRCGAGGQYKKDYDSTKPFPAYASITVHQFSERYTEKYELCDDCSRKLAGWLGDADVEDDLNELYSDDEQDADTGAER